MMPKVGFVVAGAQKSGTSLLRKYLQQHPAICTSHKKEVHFFDEPAFFKEGVPDYQAYEAMYPPARPGVLRGDVTPAYLFVEECAARVHAYNPDMKILVMLRNPVERAFSHWNMMRQKQLEPLAFPDALEAEATRAQACAPFQDKAFSYIARGRYAGQLERWFGYFPREQFLILRMEDIARNHAIAMVRVFGFLGIDPDVVIKPRFANVRPYETTLPEESRQYLQSAFHDDIVRLSSLLGSDFSDWL